MPDPLRRAARALSTIASLSLGLATLSSLTAFAQFPLPGWSGQQQQPQQPQQQQNPAPAPAPPVIARVAGRPITQRDYDRVAQPYFAQLRTQMGERFSGDVVTMAKFNVLDELIRHEVVIIEAQRQKIPVAEEETDAILRRDPAFTVNGKFDASRFAQFKQSPTSNYLQMLPALRELVAMSKLDETLRQRFTPSRAAVRDEWTKQNEKARFTYLVVQPRDMPLEPEASEVDLKAYYQAHPDEFMRKTQFRFRYFRLPLPPLDDSTRAAAEAAATARARGIADSLRAGTLPDSAAGMLDSGLFDVPAPTVPGMQRIPELADALARADTVTSLRVLGPYAGYDGMVVGAITERRPRHLPRMQEVLRDVKRRADLEKRRAVAQADTRAFYEAHRDSYRGPRAIVTRLTLDESATAPGAPSAQEVEAWYKAHGRSLFGRPDASKGWFPPLDDSLRSRVRRRLERERRSQWLENTLATLTTGLRSTRDLRGVARANGAAAETLTLARGNPPDSLFSALLVDSILAHGPEQKGSVQGPRRLGRYWALWRVDAADSAFLPPFELVRARVEQEFAEDKRKRDEAEGRAWFEQHRVDYTTPVRYTIDYIGVPFPPSDSIRISEAELRAHYQKNLTSYREEEQVHARHILISTQAATPGIEARAKARADSLHKAIEGGADFADLAVRFSEDPQSAGSAGDLGWFGRGRMVREFEQAAFALEQGDISPVVKSSFGYHIIRLDDRKPARVRPYEEVRVEIRGQLAQARADTLARRAANALRRQLALGGDPQALAATRGGLQTSAPFAAGEPAPGIGLVQGLPDDLPKLALGKWAPKAYRVGGRYLVLRPKERQPSRPAEFDEVKGRALEDARNFRRKELLDQRVAALRASLAAGASLDSLSALYGGLKDSGPIMRNFSFVLGLGFEPRLVDQAFALKPGQQSDTLQISQGVAWIRLEERDPGDEKAFEAAEAQITQDLLTKRYNEWVETKKKTLNVEVLRPDLRVRRPSGIRTVTTTTSGG